MSKIINHRNVLLLTSNTLNGNTRVLTEPCKCCTKKLFVLQLQMKFS